MSRIISFPWMGKKYSSMLKQSLENLGLNIQLPPKTTRRTINLGVKNSSEMMCLKGDTEITTDNFISKPIKDIKIGDKVLTHKGRFRRVIDTISRDYNGRILKINCGGLFKFEITPEHPVLILTRDKVKQKIFIPEFVSINKIEKKDFLAIPIPTEIKNISHFDWKKEYTHNCFKFKNSKFHYTPALLRVLGYWLAEGSIIYNRRENKTTSGISFVFSSKEKKFIKEVCEIIKKNFNCSISTRNPKHTVTEILVYSKSLADIFLELCGEKCDKKKLHKDLMNLDPKLQLEILKGYLRGDGHFNLNKLDRRYISATVSKKLANQLFWLLIRNYVKPEFASRQQKNRKKSYILRMWKGNIPLFENVSIKQIRKTYPHHIKTENYIFIPLKKIDKEDFKGKVYNLEVEEDNSYVANQLIVHNCFPYKVTLGNFIEALEDGADTLLMWDSRGQCRLRHYHKIQEFTLRNLGFDNFEMYGISGMNMYRVLRKLSGRSRIEVLSEIYFKFPKRLKEYDYKRINWSRDKPNIGIIGEIFCCCDETINYSIESRIESYGGNPFNTVTLTDFIGDGVFGKKHIPFIKDKKAKYKKEADKYLNGKLGGHGYENIYNLLELIDKKIDGVVHLLPLTCFTEETLITIKDFNSKKIKDIKKGDLILTHKGRFRKVIQKIGRDFEGEIFNINCGGILKFKVTPDHPIFSLPREFVKRNKEIKKQPSFLTMEKLKKNDFIAIPKPKKYIDKDFFKSDMENSKKPKYEDMKKFIYNKGMLRLLGYYLAEGSICYDKHKTKNRKYKAGVRFTFNKKETKFIEDIMEIIKENGIECYCKIYFRKKSPNVMDLSIYNRSLAYLLEKLGRKYCDKKEIYGEIMNLSPELQLEITKGFFRGDGCFTDKFGDTTYRAVTTSFKLVNQLFWILIRNNIKCSIIEQNIKNRKKSWMIKISNAESISRMKDELIKPKNRINNVRFLETDDYFLVPIREIKKEKFKGRVYNLEVKEDNSYVANFMAVHNCMPEVTVEPFINHICRESKTPLLRIPIDENNSEANLNTRLETFIDLIKMKK